MKSCFAVLSLLLAACASTTANDDAAPAIAGRNTGFVAGAKAGNAAQMMTIYADDAVLMPPGAPAQRGKQAIGAFWTQFLTAGAADVRLTTEKVVQSCDLATEAGHFDLTIVPKSGAPIHDIGKYVVTWRRIGGEWRVIYDVFNSDLH